MKKTMIVIGVLLAMCAFLLYSCDSAFLYGERVSIGNLSFSLHKFADVCRVEYGVWDGTDSSLVLEIPDEVDGHRVTTWGDDYPAPFVMNMDRCSMIYAHDVLPEDAQIVPLFLTIHIGDNLREINKIEMKDFYQDRTDGNVVYQILVRVCCSPENKYFYSENGKLYKRSTGDLIDLFYYQADYNS